MASFHPTWSCAFLSIKCFGLDIYLDERFSISLAVPQRQQVFILRRIVSILAEVKVSFTEHPAFVLSKHSENRLLLAELAPQLVPVDGCLHLEFLVKHCFRVIRSYGLHLGVDAFRT